MLSKSKWILGIGTTFSSQGILIPLLSSKDSKIKVVTFAGSSSLFDLFETIGDDRNNTSSKVDLNNIDFVILPTGSAWGREVLNDKKVDLALVSTKRDDSIYGGEGTNLISSAIKVIKESKRYLSEERIQDWGIATDPIVFLFHEDSNLCDASLRGGAESWKSKYRIGITSLLSSGEEPEIKENSLLSWLWTSSSTTEKFPCFERWQGYTREGNSNRSGLNRVLFAGDNKKINHLIIKEIPENNFLASEFLRRESFNNSLLAIPESFYKRNKEYLESIGLKNTGLKGGNSRRLRFELEKERLKDNYYTRLWINTLLVHSNEVIKKFKWEPDHFYWDHNLHCLSYEGEEAREVHKVTGREDGIDKNAVEDCKRRHPEKNSLWSWK